MLVEQKAKAKLPTRYGIFDIYVFEELANGKEHVAMVMGDLGDGEKVLSRIHSECLTGDIFHSLKCDCGFQLHTAMQNIAAEGRGVLIYHRAEGRGIGLTNKIKAYALQDQGMDTVEANEALGFPADMRDFNACADIYTLLGVKSVELMTNNPRKLDTMRRDGINVVARRPIVVGKNVYNENYLRVKTDKLQHMFTQDELDSQNIDVDFAAQEQANLPQDEKGATAHKCNCGHHHD
nr:GTP cyclohydrolase II [Psittacicella hinzii]